MTIKILRENDYKRMAWKNGGGETAEIAVFPPSASVDDFDWRISMATVKEDGPFSAFKGVDRTLCVLEGEGIELSVAGMPSAVLGKKSPPHTFSAEAQTSSKLLGGAIRDLNIMTRRQRYGHQVGRLTIFDELEIGSYFVSTLVMVVSDAIVEVAGASLGYLDAGLIGPGRSLILNPTIPTDIIVVKLADRMQPTVSFRP
jgi:environmental stress-induced protein Ves